jgi:hypothetical protein
MPSASINKTVSPHLLFASFHVSFVFLPCYRNCLLGLLLCPQSRSFDRLDPYIYEDEGGPMLYFDDAAENTEGIFV